MSTCIDVSIVELSVVTFVQDLDIYFELKKVPENFQVPFLQIILERARIVKSSL
jgi:hypothetical protein